ncbi:MAG TPA: hypothetical protein VI461_09720 [Chitinophagaceae bacterium]|nr:hypothetical protein [Chitinophagaceae bacterium]
MNWSVLIFAGIAAIALIVFLVIRNLKDKNDLEKKLNEDYRKSKDEEGESTVE